MVLIGLAAAACQHLEQSADQPALLVESTPAVQAEIFAALSVALGRAPTAIATDAFTRSSDLVIEPAALGDAQNPALTGRTLAASVQRFSLVIDGQQCLLLRAADGWRQQLQQARCVPE